MQFFFLQLGIGSPACQEIVISAAAVIRSHASVAGPKVRRSYLPRCLLAALIRYRIPPAATVMASRPAGDGAGTRSPLPL